MPPAPILVATLTIGNGLLDIGLASRLFVSEHATGGVALQTTSMNIANLAELSMNGGRRGWVDRLT